MTYTILICDDDADIRHALSIYLTQENYHILEAENGREALSMLETQEIQLILLDVMMPELDGISAAVQIRELANSEKANVPIIFLSAKSEDTDQILGLKMGGDDYITKPFNPIELIARVEAALRRYARLGGLPAAKAKNTYQTGGLVMNDELKKVTLDEREIAFTAIEYKILRLMMQHIGQVFSSSQIYEAVWEEPALEVTKTVSVHIRHIREKIEINPKRPVYLKVIYGLGYKMEKLL